MAKANLQLSTPEIYRAPLRLQAQGGQLKSRLKGQFNIGARAASLAGAQGASRKNASGAARAPSHELWRVSIDISAEAEEAMAELIELYFGSAPSIYINVETGRITATIFLESKPIRRELEATVRQFFARMRQFGLDPGTGRLSVTRVRNQDWAESWKRHFRPFTVGSQLLVRPGWSKRKPGRGQQVILIDPGLSFGTGQHPTTRFCLEQLVATREANARQTLLDIGTGSGILAVAAAKLGYQPVRALDFDPVAVRVAKENARKNRVHLRIARGDITKMARSATKYDVVCANLTADLLENCPAKIAGFVKPTGWLVLSGILRAQIFSVRKCFESRGFLVKKSRVEGEWESLLLQRAKI